MGDDIQSYIMEYIPDVIQMKHSLSISDDILVENGILTSLGIESPMRYMAINSDIEYVKEVIPQLLMDGKTLMCRITWNTNVVISSAYILNLFEDDTICKIHIQSDEDECAIYQIFDIKDQKVLLNIMGWKLEVFERFGRNIRLDYHLILIHMPRKLLSREL